MTLRTKSPNACTRIMLERLRAVEVWFLFSGYRNVCTFKDDARFGVRIFGVLVDGVTVYEVTGTWVGGPGYDISQEWIAS